VVGGGRWWERYTRRLDVFALAFPRPFRCRACSRSHNLPGDEHWRCYPAHLSLMLETCLIGLFRGRE
jgi:hypothetical protein